MYFIAGFKFIPCPTKRINHFLASQLRHLLHMFLGNLYCKQYGPRSDCSHESFHESSLKFTCICSRCKKQTTFSGQKKCGEIEINLFVYLFCCFTSKVNNYGHGGTVSSPNHNFSWASLIKQLTSTSCAYFHL